MHNTVLKLTCTKVCYKSHRRDSKVSQFCEILAKKGKSNENFINFDVNYWNNWFDS